MKNKSQISDLGKDIFLRNSWFHNKTVFLNNNYNVIVYQLYYTTEYIDMGIHYLCLCCKVLFTYVKLSLPDLNKNTASNIY